MLKQLTVVNAAKLRPLPSIRQHVFFIASKKCGTLIQPCTDRGAQLYLEVYCHTNSDCIFCKSVRMLRSIQTITCSFSTFHSLSVSYLTLVRSNLEYVSTVWSSCNIWWRQKPWKACSGSSYPFVKIFHFFPWPCHFTRFFFSFLNSEALHPIWQKHSILMRYVLFLFIEVWNITRVFWMLLVCLVILCFLPLAIILPLVDKFRRITLYVWTSTSSGQKNIFFYMTQQPPLGQDLLVI